MRISDPERGIFPIGVVAEMIGISQRQLRFYETKGIIQPARSEGNRRLYSQKDVELLTFIHYLVSVRKVNLAGIKVILEILSQFSHEDREALIESIETEIEGLSPPELTAFSSGIPEEALDSEAMDDTNFDE